MLTRLVTEVNSRPPSELAAVFLAVPAILVAVHLLPGTAEWRISLSANGVFENRWTLWTAFASSFVHSDTGHLLDNLGNYWLVMAVAYPLSIIAGWRHRLFYLGAGFLVIVPIVSAWVALSPAREFLYVAAGGVILAGVLDALVVVTYGTNVYAHLVGYVIGFVASFCSWLAVQG